MFWRPEDFREWRQRLGLTQTEAGKLLGLTLRAIQHYEGGTRLIPRTTELACWALEHGAAIRVCSPPSNHVFVRNL
jgi:transcriptional regulator with XRE-family HTH domain